MTSFDFKTYVSHTITIRNFFLAAFEQNRDPNDFCVSVPTLPPEQLHAENISSTQIKVWWQPPPKHSWNGDLQGYKIFYWPEGKQKDQMKERTVAGAMVNETVLDDLLMYTEYSMIILAFNAAGNGPNTTVPIKARTEEGGRFDSSK